MWNAIAETQGGMGIAAGDQCWGAVFRNTLGSTMGMNCMRGDLISSLRKR